MVRRTNQRVERSPSMSTRALPSGMRSWVTNASSTTSRLPPRFERPQGQIVAQRFDFDFEQAGIRFESEQVYTHVLDRRVEGLVEFVCDLVAGVLLEALALAVDDGSGDGIIDLVNGRVRPWKAAGRTVLEPVLGGSKISLTRRAETPRPKSTSMFQFSGGIVHTGRPASGKIAIHD